MSSRDSVEYSQFGVNVKEAVDAGGVLPVFTESEAKSDEVEISFQQIRVSEFGFLA